MDDFVHFYLKKQLFEISNNEFKRGRENEVRAGDGKLKINFQGPNKARHSFSTKNKFEISSLIADEINVKNVIFCT